MLSNQYSWFSFVSNRFRIKEDQDRCATFVQPFTYAASLERIIFAIQVISTLDELAASNRQQLVWNELSLGMNQLIFLSSLGLLIPSIYVYQLMRYHCNFKPRLNLCS